MSAPMRYRGLTWDHPRGYAALEAAAQAAAARGEIDIAWDRQPLEGFESAGLAALAERYDLIVIDHPHVGDALQAECLVPMSRLFDAAHLAAWRSASIGHSFDSYRMAGETWALPLDAATQVAVAQAERIDAPIPDTWDDVLALARRRPVALSLAGPHALLTLYSIVAAHAPFDGEADDPLPDDGAAWTAWELLRELHALADPRHAGLNPIGLLEAMTRGSEVVYCPLVYGYVNYASGARPLRFAEAPRGPAGRGSTLGGTGLALTRRARIEPALVDHVAWLMSHDAQLHWIPEHQGQPSAREAWADAGVNDASGGFYRATLATTEQAIVRPRHAGYIAFQSEASALIRQALSDRLGARDALQALRALHRRHRAQARTHGVTTP